MKKSFVKKCLLSFSSILFVTGSALAMPVAGDYVKIDTVSGLGNADGGGEFYLDISSTNSSFDGVTDYISFCVEKSENISYANGYSASPVYYIDSVSDNVYGGGVGASGGYDTLSSETQWVYYKYMFTDYFGTHTDTLANQIQEIIWFLENEQVGLSTAAQALFYSKVVGKANSSYDAYVTVINIYYTDRNGKVTTIAQSQLIGERAPVPEPTTMLLFGTGLAGLAGVARRRRS